MSPTKWRAFKKRLDRALKELRAARGEQRLEMAMKIQKLLRTARKEVAKDLRGGVGDLAAAN
jgi:hypothetical protein